MAGRNPALPTAQITEPGKLVQKPSQNAKKFRRGLSSVLPRLRDSFKRNNTTIEQASINHGVAGVESPTVQKPAANISTTLLPTLNANTQLLETIKPVQEPIVEPPLERPVQKDNKGAERPLQRPVDGTQDIAFKDITTAIAVDVSGSTLGKVLAEETQAVSKICSSLSEGARQRAKIIPWNDFSYGACSVDDLQKLMSSGGTDPSVLTEFQSPRQILQQCSTWFLLTDGEISEHYVRKFATGICNNEIHGTPCVIIIFGYKPHRPVDCNVSVGLSVFAATPDCLFLFHDLDRSKASILQAKGLFKSLLPKGCDTIILDSATTWENLPQISYRNLAKLRIPLSQKLHRNKLRLQSKREVDLDDIYSDLIDESTASEILDNDDNLKSILLVAQLRGQTHQVRRWVSKQKSNQRNILLAERPDVGQKALSTMQKLLTTIELKAPSEVRTKIQEDLRQAHIANWKVFMNIAEKEEKQASRRDVIVRDSLDRIESTENDFLDGTFSSQSMSSVSQIDDSYSSFRSPFSAADEEAYTIRDPQSAGSHLGSWSVNPERSESQVLFIPGYRFDLTPVPYSGVSNNALEGECQLCGETQTILAMLLKRPPPGEITPNFPEPGAQAGLAFPLAMGAFRETDVISSLICCHPCAYTLVRYKLTFDEEEFAAAVPLTSEAISGEYQPVTIEAVDNVLARRFERFAIESVFLAVIYSNINHLSRSESASPDDKLFLRVLRWTAAELSRKLSIAPSLSSTFGDSTLLTQNFPNEFRESLPLPEALSQSIHRIDEPLSAFLRYPVEGFVVMILAAVDLKLGVDKLALQRSVFHRFLAHLTEQHFNFLVSDKEAANDALQLTITALKLSKIGIVNTELTPPPTLPDNATSQQLSYITTLLDSHLLNAADLDQFQRLDSLFSIIEEKCMWAVLAYLDGLLNATTLLVDSGPIECFDRVRSSSKLAVVFRKPSSVDEVSFKTIVNETSPDDSTAGV